MSKIRTALLGLLLLPLLAACVGTNESSVRRPPNYATLVGIDDYEVLCGSSMVIVSRYSIEIFFNEDDTAKTRKEFCDQYHGDTRIRR